jgi:tyrosyl-tRNA synthetase
MTLADIFVRAGLAKSKGEARRLGSQGGLYVNDERIESADVPLSLVSEGSPEGTILLRSGKKNYRRLRIID